MIPYWREEPKEDKEFITSFNDKFKKVNDKQLIEEKLIDESFKIYKMRVCGFLLINGLKLLGTIPNRNNPTYDIYRFDISKKEKILELIELCEIFEEYRDEINEFLEDKLLEKKQKKNK